MSRKLCFGLGLVFAFTVGMSISAFGATLPTGGTEADIEQANTVEATVFSWLKRGLLLLGIGATFKGYQMGKRRAQQGEGMSGGVVEGTAIGAGLGFAPLGIIQAHQVGGSESATFDSLARLPESAQFGVDTAFLFIFVLAFTATHLYFSMRRHARWKTAFARVRRVSPSK